MEQGMQLRTELLLGKENLKKLNQANILIFGVGGVGSWCAEALVRGGIRHLTVVDSDSVCITNCNRQLIATSHTIGQVKVEALKERLLEVCPSLEIQAIHATYDASTAESFHLEQYDYIVDAIDSLSSKADLILRATALPKNTMLVSSMGAALRTDPFKVRKAEFWKVQGDALARALRNKFKKEKQFPKRKFYCVYSEEVPMKNLGNNLDTPEAQRVEGQISSNKAQVNGSLCHVTAAFGMGIASIVINDIIGASK